MLFDLYLQRIYLVLSVLAIFVGYVDPDGFSPSFLVGGVDPVCCALDSLGLKNRFRLSRPEIL